MRKNKNRLYVNKDFLKREYKQLQSCLEISKKYNISYTIIYNRLREFNIKRVLKSKIMKCQYCFNKFLVYPSDIKANKKFCSKKCHNKYKLGKPAWNKNKRISKISGENHYFWKGGITPLCRRIRHLIEATIWRRQVFERDNYTCQDCGIRSGMGHKVYIHAHHIRAFTLIFNEFLKTYNQFSPIEDKETLVRLAITHQPFWDIANGQTLCKKCHNKIKATQELFI